MPEITLNCRIVTPAFVGGADSIGDQARRDPPTLRPSGIIGPLRYWFRALAGKECGGDPAAVYKMEEAVFGSRNRAAAVRVSIKNCRVEPEELRRPPLRLAYLGGQGLFQWNSERKEYEPTRRSFRPGGTFDLCLSGPPTQLAAAYASTLALLWFGGIGSRSRKGFGSLSACARPPQGYPGPNIGDAPDPQNALASSLDWCRGTIAGFTEAAGSYKATGPLNDMPGFPCFGMHWGRWKRLESSDAVMQLGAIGAALREFREDPVASEGRGRPVTLDYTGVVSSFMAGGDVEGEDLVNDAFGLPVHYRSSRGRQATVSWRMRSSEDVADQRRASPLWISLSPTGDGRSLWASVLLLGSDFLPEGAEEVLFTRRGDDRHIQSVATGDIVRLGRELFEDPGLPLLQGTPVAEIKEGPW